MIQYLSNKYHDSIITVTISNVKAQQPVKKYPMLNHNTKIMKWAISNIQYQRLTNTELDNNQYPITIPNTELDNNQYPITMTNTELDINQYLITMTNY